ncbi:hypothetical protein GJ496_005484 [Pomphorhynchus laevis]|nr:hypothetical protein GJ496_005484 [Pomphorhynchus laevis]
MGEFSGKNKHKAVLVLVCGLENSGKSSFIANIAKTKASKIAESIELLSLSCTKINHVVYKFIETSGYGQYRYMWNVALAECNAGIFIFGTNKMKYSCIS